MDLMLAVPAFLGAAVLAVTGALVLTAFMLSSQISQEEEAQGTTDDELTELARAYRIRNHDEKGA